MSGPALNHLVLDAPRDRSGDARLILAYSGGLDSTVLLHLLARSAESRVQAVHVHHGLQPAAEHWATHCAAVCAALGVPMHLCRVQVQGNGQGLEAAAREARYGALRAQMRQGDVLVTAHHQNDQAETVLLRLLRGTGPSGLAAMRPVMPFPPGLLWRPLLDVPRAELRAYAEAHGLQWIEDPQNTQGEFSRSFLRSEILPRLQTHWPAASRSLARAAELGAETAELLRELAEADLHALGAERDGLPIPALKELSAARRHNLLRHWVETRALPVPFRDTLSRVDSEVFGAVVDADPVLAWPGGEFRRYRERLFVMATLPAPPADSRLTWNTADALSLPTGCGRLQARQDAGAVQVRWPRPGERFRPRGAVHSRSLKNLFQERGIPTWVRLRTPVLERDGQAVWIGGIGWAQGAESFDLEWMDRPPGASRD